MRYGLPSWGTLLYTRLPFLQFNFLITILALSIQKSILNTYSIGTDQYMQLGVLPSRTKSLETELKDLILHTLKSSKVLLTSLVQELVLKHILTRV